MLERLGQRYSIPVDHFGVYGLMPEAATAAACWLARTAAVNQNTRC